MALNKLTEKQWKEIEKALFTVRKHLTALERPSATEPDEDISKEPCPQCGSKEKVQCGDPAIHECDRRYHAWDEPAAQEDALVNDMARVFWLEYAKPGKGATDGFKAVLAVARQHFAAHPVTAQVVQKALIDRLTHEWHDMTSDPNDFRVSDDGKRFASHSEVARFIIRGLARLAPKQKTPEEPEERTKALESTLKKIRTTLVETPQVGYKQGAYWSARVACIALIDQQMPNLHANLAGGDHERTPTP